MVASLGRQAQSGRATRNRSEISVGRSGSRAKEVSRRFHAGPPRRDEARKAFERRRIRPHLSADVSPLHQPFLLSSRPDCHIPAATRPSAAEYRSHPLLPSEGLTRGREPKLV